MDLSLSGDEKKLLLALAREAVQSFLEGRHPRRYPDSPGLRQRVAAFVTLRKPGGGLRGCIGNLNPRDPLNETVEEMARSAAFQDPRFEQVKIQELPELRFEISLLSPFRRASQAEELVPGVHGAYIKQGSQRGILLPKVATEQGWDRAEFLSQACLKAGLDREAWKRAETEIHLFTSLDFSE